jgi:hypothetical protein
MQGGGSYEWVRPPLVSQVLERRLGRGPSLHRLRQCQIEK